jgi:hypothetical protein
MARHDRALPIGLIVLVVLVGNALYLLGVFDPNPMDQYSRLVASSTPGVFPGVNAIDPNSGFNAQALGHRAVLDWLSGHIPWWNPFEGVGSPLAGEMQAAALFPFTVLLYFSNGQLFEHIILELIAGISTFLLLNRFLRSRWAAAMGGVAFALNGTFASIQHAPANAIAFLPLLLLGLETAREASCRGRKGGWALIAVALALSVSSGFPETSFIDGLVVVVWFVARCRRLERIMLVDYVRKTIAGGVTGLLLSAPLLVAFDGYLRYANIGAHNGVLFDSAFGAATQPRIVFPFIYGPLGGFSQFDRSGVLSTVWIEGFLSVSLVTLAAIGIFGSRYRVLRLALVAWIVLAMGKTYGLPGTSQILGTVPGLKSTAFSVYSVVAWEFAVIVLAAFAVDDLTSGRSKRPAVLVASAGTLIFGLVEVHLAQPLVRSIAQAPHAQTWSHVSIIGGLIIFLMVTVVAVFLPPRLRVVPLVTIVVLESLALFIVPEFSAPRSVTLDTGSVSFLQRRAGLYRFYTLGPIQPNYGSYFSIGSTATNDLPPKLWSQYVVKSLDQNVDPVVFTGTTQANPTGPSTLSEFLSNMGNYESIATKYLVIPTGLPLPASAEVQSLKLVYHDPVAEVYQLPDPTPFFRTSGAACVVTDQSSSEVKATCSGRATLTRQELYMPGWTATVNGKGTAISERNDLVQSVPLGKGTDLVVFRYEPPHIVWGYLGFVIGVALLIGVPLARRRTAPSPNRPGRRSNRRPDGTVEVVSMVKAP